MKIIAAIAGRRDTASSAAHSIRSTKRKSETDGRRRLRDRALARVKISIGRSKTVPSEEREDGRIPRSPSRGPKAREARGLARRLATGAVGQEFSSTLDRYCLLK